MTVVALPCHQLRRLLIILLLLFLLISGLICLHDHALLLVRVVEENLLVRHGLVSVHVLAAHHGDRPLSIHENPVCRSRLFVIYIVVDEAPSKAEIVLSSSGLCLGGLLLSLVL